MHVKLKKLLIFLKQVTTSESESESECKCLTCSQKPTGSQLTTARTKLKKTKKKTIEQSGVRSPYSVKAVRWKGSTNKE